MKHLWILAGICALNIGTAEAKIMPKFVPAPTKLYNFTEDVQKAVETCADYTANFSVKDTPYAHYGDFAGKTEVVPEFRIYGIKHGLCRMRVRFSALGKGETRFTCRLNDEQRLALLSAMQDKSTEEYVITIPGQGEQDCSGCNEAVSFSGNLFDTMVAMLKAHACVERHIQPTKDEIVAARAEGNRFSEDFEKALHNCTPGAEIRETGTVKGEVRVLGQTEDELSCRLQYSGFDLTARKREVKTVYDYDDMQRMLINNLDKAQYRYDDKYSATGLLFALAECRDANGTDTADENIFQYGNIQARTGVSSHRVRNVCHIELKNTIAIADIYFRDYSLLCPVSYAQWPRLIGKYQHLIDDMGAEDTVDKNGVLHRTSAQYSAEIRAADADILQQLRTTGLCFPKPPVDPIKQEIEHLQHRDAVITK